MSYRRQHRENVGGIEQHRNEMAIVMAKAVAKKISIRESERSEMAKKG
jgi:hypothetical protein